MNEILKYPRTRHLHGSGLQKGDEDLNVIPFAEIFGKHLVIEDKIDGANTGISFSDDCELLLQSRGHYLKGGDWPEFDMFKLWGNTFKSELFDILSDRYIMYGEWMYAFHSVFYDNLPHYFMEFDIFDRVNEVFLDTPSRRKITSQCAANIESVKVVGTGAYETEESILSLLDKSSFITPSAVNHLELAAKETGMAEDDIELIKKLNSDGLMEGLYVKWEEDGIVKGRYKFVRSNFVQTILDYGKHWTDRPTIPNMLADSRNIFETGETGRE